MRRLLMALALLVTAATQTAAQCSDAEKAALQSFDRAFGDATARGDRAYLQQAYADEYAGTSFTGTLGKAATIDDAVRQAERSRANAQAAPRIAYDNYIISCTPTTATITHRTAFTTTADGRERTTYGRSVHVLERRDGRWQVVTNANHPLDDASVLLYMESDWNDAVKRRDPAWFERYLAADATAVFARTGAVQSKAEVIASLKADRTTLESLELSEVAARVDGDAAIVTGVNRLRGRDEQGKPFDRRVRFTDTFVRRDGRWQVWATQATAVP